MNEKSDVNWSEWFEFDKEKISVVPETPGIFRMHAAMKIFHIGNTENLRKELSEKLVAPCTSEATRFCYMETQDHEKLKDILLTDYQNRHEGKLPKCMQE